MSLQPIYYVNYQNINENYETNGYNIPWFHQYEEYSNSVYPTFDQNGQPIYYRSSYTYGHAYRPNGSISCLNPTADEYFPRDAISLNTNCRCNHVNPINLYYSKLNPNANSYYPSYIMTTGGLNTNSIGNSYVQQNPALPPNIYAEANFMVEC